MPEASDRAMTHARAAAAREAHRLMQAGRLVDALGFAERAADGARVCGVEHGLLASLLLRLGRVAQAEQAVTQALALGTGSAEAYDALAFVSMALGQHDRANDLYRRATGMAPGDPRLWYNLACSERSVGRLAEAEGACDRAIAIDGTQYPSLLLRSELRVQSPDANHVGALEAELDRRATDYRARVFLGYALAKELDDLGRFDDAFRWFHAAATARRARLDYDVATDERKLSRIAEVYSADLLAHAPGATGRSGMTGDFSRFVFIVGLPRSGTTLVERILTGLPGVRSNGETDHFSNALLAAQRGTGDVFEKTAAADLGAVATEYARLALPGPAAERVVEKLPLNYLYVGAIHRSLPQARILVVRRSPLDSCFAMYRTLFAAGYPFSYDLAELARYYAAYQRLMDHWRAALGEALHEIVYEDLVREPRRVGAAIANHCGLPWSDTAIDIQANRAASLTASAAQVRRPIYGTSSGRWRHYRAHLGTLIGTLRDCGVPVPA
jgi:tetratricopeptide (TPR) repeat protein